jgi:hypothetical protein
VPWSAGPYARTSFADRGVGSSAPAGQQTLPPPIPGGTATWLYEPNRSIAYAFRGWAGRLTPTNYPGGGISIRPVAARGIMEITAWWPDAPFLSLVRVDPDGATVPVRGGSPVVAPGSTRRNLCQNPSFEAGLNGTVPDLGTPTLTNPNDGTATRGALYLKATIASAGSCGVVVPAALTSMQSTTIGFDLRLSAAATSLTVQVSWTDISGAALTATSATLTTDQINNSIAQFSRQVVQFPAAAGAAGGTVKIIAGGLPAGAAMSLDGVTIEAGQTDGSYFDGATYGATWLGTAQLSASALAPLCVVEDGECPLDVSVRYRLVNPSATGGTMTSDRATLPSGERVWLTHPTAPDSPVEILIEKRPLRGKDANQGVFQAIDDPLFLTIGSRRRSGWRSSESVAIWTEGSEQTEQLLAYIDDNLPVLIRTPVSLNYGPPLWISLGNLEEDPDGAAPWQQLLKISAPWVQVAAPVV